jgi:hypothetical protein
MLGKFSGNFGNFSLLGKVINVDFFHFCPKNWAFSKIPMQIFLAFWEFLFCSIIMPYRC